MLDLLSVLGNRENYERFSRFVRKEAIGGNAATIVDDLEEYYHTHSVDDVDWERFSEWFKVVKHPTFKEEKYVQFDKVFERLSEHTSSEGAEAIIAQFIKQDYAAKIADLALQGAEGGEFDMSDVEQHIEAFYSQIERATSLDMFYVTDDLEEILEEAVSGGLKWRMKFLNQSIGSIHPGKLICFAARPNTGKTTWLASEVTYIASQLEPDECILWFNNEEAGRNVRLRIYQAALQTTTAAIQADPKKAMLDYQKAVNGGLDKIKVVDKADINTKDVEEFCRNNKVRLIIFDQLWKVKGFEKSSATDTARLGNIFQWARELAKTYAPVITVHQVKTEGEGVEWLTPSMLYLSGTVIQGEVDSLILMGRNYSPGQEYNRFINIGKNKGAYGPEVDLSLAEGKAIVMIEPTTAQFLEAD